MDAWVTAFFLALALMLLAVPLLKRLALATGFVDRPASRKSHSTPIPYLGGVALIVAVLVAILVQGRLPDRIGGLAFGAALIGTMGLLDDDRNLGPGLRMVAELVAAAVAVGLGLRIHATGVDWLDVIITVVWIVGITNAMNLMDNMDGLAGGVAGTAALAVLWLSLAQGQEVTATVAAALAGACFGFLVFNRRPASVFMGDAGSLFLGFVLSVLTVDVSPALSPPGSFAIPVMLLSLPVLDTTTVTLARLRRGRSVSEGGRDHLSHRLVARGLSPGPAVAVLVAVQAVVGGVAVLAGLRVIELRWAVLVVGAVLFGLWSYTARADVYEEEVVGLPRRLRLAMLAGVGGVLLLAGPSLIALALALGPARAGAEGVATAFAAIDSGSADVTARLSAANRDFERARDRLHAPGTSAALALPGLASNLRAARALADAGYELTRQAANIAALADAGAVELAPPSTPLDELSRLTPRLVEGANALRLARAQLSSVGPQPYLAGPLRRTAERLDADIARAAVGLDRAATLGHLLPPVLGTQGERRYLVTFQDGRDLRFSGGSITAWNELVATPDALDLSVWGSRVADTPSDGWDEATRSPDFPTAAARIKDLFRAETGRALNGVIAMDRAALVALAQLTATPVEMAEGDAPSPDTVRRIWETTLTSRLGSAAAVAGVLAEAVRDGHLFLALSDPVEQRLAADIGADGSLPGGNEDSLLVLSEGLPGGLDGARLHRRVNYDIHLEPGRDTTALTGRLEVTLANATPPSGPAQPSHTHVSVVSPFGVREATLDGVKAATVIEQALGQQVGSVPVAVEPNGQRVVRMDLAGRVELGTNGWYRLGVARQPALLAEPVVVTITVPRGWKIAETRGLRLSGSRIATADLDDQREHTLWARLERTGWAGFWDRLRQAAHTAPALLSLGKRPW